jgi:hypothetical protein
MLLIIYKMTKGVVDKSIVRTVEFEHKGKTHRIDVCANKQAKDKTDEELISRRIRQLDRMESMKKK